MNRRSLLFALSIFGVPSAVIAQDSRFRQTSISLYSPEFLWVRDGPNEEALASYLAELGDAAEQALRSRPEIDASGSVVVALKPTNQSRVWVVTGTQRTTDVLQEALAGTLEKVRAPPVRGVLALALDFDIGRGGQQPERLQGVIAVPEEWAKVLMEKGGRIPDDALSVVWP